MGKVNRKSFNTSHVPKRSSQTDSRTPKKFHKRNSRRKARQKAIMSNNINKFEERLKHILKSNSLIKKPNMSINNNNQENIPTVDSSIDDASGFIMLYPPSNEKKQLHETNVFPTHSARIENPESLQPNNTPTTSTPYKANPPYDGSENSLSLLSPIVDHKRNKPPVTNCSNVIDVIDLDNTLVTVDEIVVSSSDNETVIDVDSIECTDETVHPHAGESVKYITISDSIDLTINTPVKSKRKRNKNKSITPIKSTKNHPTNVRGNVQSGEKIASIPSTVDVLAQNILGPCYRPAMSVSGYFGTNIYRPRTNSHSSGLRMVVIDGSNVAMQHTHGKFFSVEGLNICIDYFLKRGHIVKAFVPRFRNKNGKSSNPKLLQQLEERGHVVYTPSRQVRGQFVTSYDDRYIVQCAASFDGVVVSSDDYRDILNENENLRETIEKRLLPFTWVDNMIMFPQDPLGRNGPKLDAFLRHS